MNSITSRQVNIDFFPHGNEFHFEYEGKNRALPSIDKVHAFFQKQPFDTVKLCHEGKKSYVHFGLEEIKILDSKKTLRKTLSQEGGGAWLEEKDGKKRYFVDDSGWFSSSFKQISKQEYSQVVNPPSSIQKVNNIGFDVLGLTSRIFKLSNHIPSCIGMSTTIIGLIASTLIPSQVNAQAVGAEFQVNNYTNDHQDSPNVAGLIDGGFVVAWASLNQDGDQYGIYGQRFNADARAIASEFQVHTVTTDIQWQPSVAALMDGGFIVIWEGFGDNYDIFGQRYAASGTSIGSEFLINNVTLSTQEDPSIATLADGGFVVVWTSSDGASDGIFAQRFSNISTPIGLEFQVNNYTTNSQKRPNVTPLRYGGFVVAWESFGQDGDFYGIFGQRFDANGSAVGTEFQVNTYTTSNQLNPGAASLNDGGFVITWDSVGQDGENQGVYAQRYDRDGNIRGSEFQVSTYTPLSQSKPSIAGLEDGGFIVTWHSENQDGDSLGVYAQRYDVNSTSSGPEFLVNTFVTGAQLNPSIASLRGGGFVVIWESMSQDGHRNGVFGKQYDENGLEIIPPTSSSMSSLFSSTSSSRVRTSISSSSQFGVSSPSSGSVSILPSNTDSRKTTQSEKGASTTPQTDLSDSRSESINILPASTVSSMATSEVNAPSSTSSFFIPSIVDLVYEETYSIVVNDQIVGTFTFFGGNGNLQSGITNTLTIEIDLDYLPEEGDPIVLFTLPDYEDWDIVLSGASTDCRKAIQEIEETESGEYEYVLYLEDGTCAGSSSFVFPAAISLMTN